ncbi:hypothetical protein CBI38_35555 (plasmid) [Rhodococcus oxybenzonivorans]|uniref:Uncharacterized protein n=1 Tax=Rhodococcus oxybenzonivorans TaxID=1990687 RepID=A0A2S2C7F0_9NOCA|nr:hypothetical protein [Rhodococcus oxybenzonivorans]AWK76754.1 hypothetical protein CBI38_35555 [Rhodococcus oxybenzonivorans]
MTDPTPDAGPPRSDEDRGSPPRREPTPRWVKVVGIVVGILLVLVILMMVFGGGNHGPGRHLSAGTTVGSAAISGDVDVMQSSGGSVGDRLGVRTVAA